MLRALAVTVLFLLITAPSAATAASPVPPGWTLSWHGIVRANGHSWACETWNFQPRGVLLATMQRCVRTDIPHTTTPKPQHRSGTPAA